MSNTHRAPSGEEEEDELRMCALRRARAARRTRTPLDYLTIIRTSQRGRGDGSASLQHALVGEKQPHLPSLQSFFFFFLLCPFFNYYYLYLFLLKFLEDVVFIKNFNVALNVYYTRLKQSPDIGLS